MDKTEILNIKVIAAKKGWDWAMNFCNNLCVQISDDYNNDDQIEQADAAIKCYRKIQANMGYYPTDIETAEWKENNAAMELQLPVLFMEWWISDSVNSIDRELEDLTPKELYDYWVENIYKI